MEIKSRKCLRLACECAAFLTMLGVATPPGHHPTAVIVRAAAVTPFAGDNLPEQDEVDSQVVQPIDHMVTASHYPSTVFRAWPQIG